MPAGVRRCSLRRASPKSIDWKKVEAALPATIAGWKLVKRAVEWDAGGLQSSVALHFAEEAEAGRTLVLRVSDEGPWHPARLLTTGVVADDRQSVSTVDWGCPQARPASTLAFTRKQLVLGDRRETVGDARLTVPS